MKHPIARHLSLVASLIALVGLVVFLVLRKEPPVAIPENRPASPPNALSLLAASPDWNSLTAFQNSITRADFEQLLTSVFTVGNAWQSQIQIGETEAIIQTGNAEGGGTFHLRFADPGSAIPSPRDWRSAAQLPPTSADQPLAGMRIAIDPGHIGGEWAKMEARWFVIGQGTPVSEGDMTLRVANLLKPQLEAMGAQVSMVRSKNEPVTALRPDSLRSLALGSSTAEDSPAALQRLAERLFYRTAEIHARAELVNRTLKPDLVLCLHFNAEAWGDPNHPTLTEKSHFHLVLNGAYTNEEVTLADQRFALLKKLLQRTHDEEVRVGASIAEAFAATTALPAFTYAANSENARPVADQPYLWLRNLLANRLYDCPVIFMEPYVMNSSVDYARIQAGDYDGLREIAGKSRPSIFREYADALASGIAAHYTRARKSSQPAATTD
jgi:N-acetylmuramoyl-L-alanine amidase